MNNTKKKYTKKEMDDLFGQGFKAGNKAARKSCVKELEGYIEKLEDLLIDWKFDLLKEK